MSWILIVSKPLMWSFIIVFELSTYIFTICPMMGPSRYNFKCNRSKTMGEGCEFGFFWEASTTAKRAAGNGDGLSLCNLITCRARGQPLRSRKNQGHATQTASSALTHVTLLSVGIYSRMLHKLCCFVILLAQSASHFRLVFCAVAMSVFFIPCSIQNWALVMRT